MEQELAPVKEDDRRDIPAVRESMKALTQYINASDQEIKRLSATETHLNGRVAMLTASVNGAERQLLEAREEVRRLAQREKELQAEVRELTSRVERGDDNLRRRAEEAEETAAVYGDQNETLKGNADLGVRLSEESQKMIDAIDRLPKKMEDSTPVRSDERHDIPLYGTYEWQAVADAKLLLQRTLGGAPDAASSA